MLRIVMDGAGDMPAEWSQEYDIDVIPINIHFGEQTFLQGVDMSDADFYRIAEESGTIPKTSQPSPAQFVEFYKKVADPGDTILSIHVTGKLSGTVESAEIAARELQGQYNVIPIDSYSGSAAMGYMCREARQMERAGAPLQKILDRLEFIRQNINIVLTLNNLEYARRSGRVKALQAALASLLNVKPVIILTDGVLDMADRVRTRSRSLEYVVDSVIARVGKRPVNAAVVHAEDPQSGNLLMELVRARLNCKDLIMTGLAISVAANLGPGTVGVVAYPVE
ncbi:MAG: DegV family protein [Anaerolineales bacterium]|jgi:DegV family protein with EDD domain